MFSSVWSSIKMEISSIWSMAFSFAFATIIVAIYAWKILNWIWLKPKKVEKLLRQQGLSGSSYKLFHGDTKEISRMNKEASSRAIPVSDNITSRILPFEHHIISKYGKNSFMWMGPTASIFITDPSFIKEIFYKHEIFQKFQRNPLIRLFINGMVLYEGEQWFKVRNIANPAFHLDKLKDMLPQLYISCSDMVEKWKTLVSEKESYELDVWPHIQTLTADVISRTAFGSNFEEGRQIFELVREQLRLSVESLQYVYVPGWRFLPTATNRKLKANYNEVQKLIKGVINKREEALKVRRVRNDDLLGLLMESNYKAVQHKEAGMSLQEVIEECKLFYIAGQETTASLLVWTMILLSIHPHWQERAREEVFQVSGSQVPIFDDLNKLKVVTQILYEVLRLYPPAAMLTRINVKETKLGEIVLPPGIVLLLPIIKVHQDPEYWGDDAEVFNPERFSEGISKATKNNQVAFFPFTWGPRICIGQNFALMEAKLALAIILRNFSFQLSPTYIHVPARRLTLYPQHGAQIILHKI
ncbi:Cytochrome P450 [Melia azedarach]|uniref:Cytochrome P450 n=1 Tax=Melia azedarach TaxID=155640 RepID=A0ACC1Y230_MELAZ|nr:Cytochrome P450 [Melia azedarach]